MPRPKRPERVRGALGLDKHLPAHIGAKVDKLINVYNDRWKPGDRRGRRNETTSGRNALFNDLAALFHQYSFRRRGSWVESPTEPNDRKPKESEADYVKRRNTAHERDYRRDLKAFLSAILVANQIPYPLQVVTRFQYIDSRYQMPRD